MTDFIMFLLDKRSAGGGIATAGARRIGRVD
jgi:hypothetical protein